MKNLFDQWKINLESYEKGTLDADVCVIPLWQGQKLDTWVAGVDKDHHGAISTWLKSSFVVDKRESAMFFANAGEEQVQDFYVINLGDAKKAKADEIRNAFGRASVAITKRGYQSVNIVQPAASLDFDHAMEGFLLGSYRFAKYFADKKKSQTLTNFTFFAQDKQKRKMQTALDKVSITTKATFLARDLVNEAPNVLYPESFAKIAKDVAKDRPLTIKVMGPAELKKQKMNLLLSVGQASVNPARLVHLHYKPKKKAKKKIALVGKGVTYDTGGLSLKPAAFMSAMKTDMAGAASVLATMQAVADLKLPIEVHGILGLVENSVAGNATRPDDIVTARNGKTVEIENTDAEGRLVLADALNYAEELGVDYMMDVATLTGACVVALGKELFAIYSSDDKLGKMLHDASAEVGEKAWPMPLVESYKSQLKSDFADLRNVGDRHGGSITAALFLSHFVEKTKWAHLDIAGPARAGSSMDTSANGATGIPSRTFIRFLENLR